MASEIYAIHVDVGEKALLCLWHVCKATDGGILVRAL